MLTDSHSIPDFYPERWAGVSSHVLVSLFVSVIFWNIMKVVSAYNHCACHLRRYNFAGENTATDGDISSEWTLLVCKIKQS